MENVFSKWEYQYYYRKKNYEYFSLFIINQIILSKTSQEKVGHSVKISNKINVEWKDDESYAKIADVKYFRQGSFCIIFILNIVINSVDEQSYVEEIPKYIE